MLAPSACKPKYACELLWQLYIIDTTTAYPILQKAYLANALVNLRGLSHIFYKMNLLLEHQNGELKYFRSNQSLFLQETNQMFRLHILLVDTLAKIRRSMNWVIIGWERSFTYPTKNALFDILSLAN